MNKLGAQSDSARSLVVAAIGWCLLSRAPEVVLGVALGMNHSLNGPEMPQETRYLLLALTVMAENG
jgi:hypothetical protein